MVSSKQNHKPVAQQPKESIDIPLLLNRVEQPIDEWINRKGYCKRSLTVSKAANSIGIASDDLRNYLKYVAKEPFCHWTYTMRNKDNKALMGIRDDILGKSNQKDVGNEDSNAFGNSFKKSVGVYPTTWILEKMTELGISSEQLHERITAIMSQIKLSLDRWERAMGYRKRYLNAKVIAKALSVKSEDLKTYCQLILMDSIEHWVEQQRVYDAKIILRLEPKRSIASVGDMLGFTNTVSFRNSFEKLTSYTPEAWRGEPEERKTESLNPAFINTSTAPVFDVTQINKWKRQKGYCHAYLTQHDVARMVGFSDSRFSQYLQIVVKDSFSNWIASMRIEEAKRLLKSNSSLTILQVASKVGIPNKATFYTLFKQFTGLTPDLWRFDYD